MHTTRYGLPNLYGDDHVYGNASIVRRLTWGLTVDWHNDGLFHGFNEAIYAYDLEVTNGRTFYLTGDGVGFEPMGEGEVVVSLRNESGRFDPYNTSGELYGSLLPGRKFVLVVRDESTGITHPVMTGRIKDIRPVYGTTNNVKLELVNEIRELKRLEVNTAVETQIRYDDALELLLTEAGWTGPRDIDTTVSEVMFYWWAGGDSLFNEINSIVEAALGIWCIGEDGSLTYKSRIASDSVLVSLTGLDVQLDYGIRVPTPWDTVRNKIRVYSRTRLLSTDAELWSLLDVMLIPANSQRELWADFSLNGQEAVAQTITTPVSTTDYLGNAQADGSGANRTSDLSVSVTSFSRRAKITVTNTSGTDLYVTFLRLRGDALTPDNYTFVEGEDSVSIAEFGEQPFVLNSDWLQDVNTAIDEKNILLSRLSSIRKYPRVKIIGHPDLQFGARLLGLVEINFPSQGISGEFRVGHINHRWIDEIGAVVETELFLEPNLLGNVEGTWVFPAVFGSTTIFG